MFVVWTIIAALLILSFWAAVLWLAARSDRKYLEQERLDRIFGDPKDG